MKLTDAEAIRLRSIMRNLSDADGTWLYDFVSRHTEPCRRWPSALDHRDEAIRQAFEEHYAGLGPTAGAAALAGDLARWKETGWKRHAGDPYPEGVDERSLALHHILLAKDELIGARQIFNVLTKTRAGV